VWNEARSTAWALVDRCKKVDSGSVWQEPQNGSCVSWLAAKVKPLAARTTPSTTSVTSKVRRGKRFLPGDGRSVVMDVTHMTQLSLFICQRRSKLQGQASSIARTFVTAAKAMTAGLTSHLVNRTIDRYARGVVLVLACPFCLDARERETRQFQTPQVCPDCGDLLLIDCRLPPHLVLKCRLCGNVFEGVEGQAPSCLCRSAYATRALPLTFHPSVC
jgi:hypothetical protein